MHNLYPLEPFLFYPPPLTFCPPRAFSLLTSLRELFLLYPPPLTSYPPRPFSILPPATNPLPPVKYEEFCILSTYFQGVAANNVGSLAVAVKAKDASGLTRLRGFLHVARIFRARQSLTLSCLDNQPYSSIIHLVHHFDPVLVCLLASNVSLIMESTMASHHHHHAIEPGSDAERLESQAGVDEDQGSGPSTDDVSKNLQESLLKALEGINHKTHTAPPFAVVSPIGGSRPLGHPGIHVGGVGDIQLPLTVNQARQIIAKAQRARHVNLKGSKSLVNTSLRNTWELDPDLFELKNPYWEQRICNLARHVVEELGIDDITIRAELYKMVIYEKGAMFKAHTE